MNFYLVNLSIAYAIVGIELFVLGIFVFLKNRDCWLNKIFCVYSLSISVWSLSSLFLIQSSNVESANIFNRILLLGAICIPTLFLDFTLELLNKRKTQKRLLQICYLTTFIFQILNFLPHFTKDSTAIYKLPHFTTADTGYVAFFSFFVIVAVYGIFLLFNGWRSAHDPMRKRQLFYLFIFSLIGYSGGTTTFLTSMNIHPFSPLMPWGTYLVALYGLMVTYSIIKHQLMDITIIIKRSLVYSSLIACISIFYLLIVFVLEYLIQYVMNYSAPFVRIVTAFLLGILLIPIKNKIQHIVDKSLYKGTPEEISNQNEQLLKEVAQSEKLKAVAALASGMAHEIKNPLTAIRTFSEHIPNKKNDPIFLDNFSKIVTKEVDRIDDLVHQLMEFAKPAPLDLKSVSISNIIDETLEFLNNNLITNKIKVIKNYGSANNFVWIDKAQMKQAFLNIILNAIDAMPEGGTLSIGVRVQGLGDREKAKTLHPTPYTLNPNITISISDTGKGIAKEDLKHIFEPFYSRKDKGTGLGLAVTYGIITEHKGKIKVSSQTGVGSEFFITLPSIRQKKS